MKIKNRRWHKKRYLETNILNSVSKGKILKQVDIKVPEKYALHNGFDCKIESDYNIKVCKFYTKLDKIDGFQSIWNKYITILNKNEYEKQLQNLSKPLESKFYIHPSIKKIKFSPTFTSIDDMILEHEDFLDKINRIPIQQDKFDSQGYPIQQIDRYGAITKLLP